MKRLIPFVLAVCCAVGLILGSVTALTENANDLVFTEIVKFGDPAALDGRVIESGIACGNHMEWKTKYAFSGENRYDTEFVFSQTSMAEQDAGHRSQMEAYTTGGFGGSTTGDMSLRNTGYGNLFRAVAAVTPAGEQQEMNLKLKDYVDYHALCLDISYYSDRYYCSEYVDIFAHITAQWDDDTMDFDQWTAENSPSFREFSQLFRIPVGEEEIVSVNTQRDNAGNLVSLGMNFKNSPSISIICAVNDAGAYCIPSCYDENGEPIIGEYRDGMGIYYIPWKPDPRAYGQNSSREAVMLDCARAENIQPLPEDTLVFGLEVDEDTGMARMISLEGKYYYLTEIDLVNGEIRSRLEILEKGSDVDYYWPNWQIRGNLMILEACENLALITLGEEPELEFVVPLGEAEDGYWDVVDDYGAMHFDGEKLTLAACRGFYDERSLVVQVYDSSGPLYWGEYECSVFKCNDPGASPYIHSSEHPLIIR